MTDEKRVEDLEKRIDELESMVRSTFPSRRDALKLGVAGVAGAAAMSGTASAGSNQVGTIGDANNLVDIEAEDVTINDTLNGASISGAAQDEALLSDGAGGLTFAEAGGGLPPNFSYNNQIKDYGVTYTNNSGKTLYVLTWGQITSDTVECGFEAYVDSSQIKRENYDLNTGQFDAFSTYLNIDFFVPDGSDYRVDTNGVGINRSRWFEIEM